MINPRLALCLPLLFAAQASSFATAAHAQSRDPTAAQAKGTASIQGKVTSADGGRPLRRVQISPSSPELSEARRMSTTPVALTIHKP